MGVLEHFQVPSHGCPSARLLIPRAPVLVRVLEHVQVPTIGCVSGRLLIPRTSVLAGILEYIQFAQECGSSGHFLCQIAPFTISPLHAPSQLSHRIQRNRFGHRNRLSILEMRIQRDHVLLELRVPPLGVAQTFLELRVRRLGGSRSRRSRSLARRHLVPREWLLHSRLFGFVTVRLRAKPRPALSSFSSLIPMKPSRKGE